MKIIIFIAITTVLMAGCEIFVIGPVVKPREVVNIDQTTALGAVYVFKSELDSNNSPGATDVLAAPDGRMLLAIERYELFWEMDRMKRMIADMPVTYVKIDTLSSQKHKIEIEFDYLKRYHFTTTQLGESWYILDYERSF